jgi:hypothetical protein
LSTSKFRYRFTGEQAEEFHQPPGIGLVQPGAEVVVEQPVEHARLVLVTDDDETAKKPKESK